MLIIKVRFLSKFLNFYFDMHVEEERKRKEQLVKRDTGQGLGLFECGEYFRYFYKGGQLIDRQLQSKEMWYILCPFPLLYVYKVSLPLTSKLRNMKYLQVNVFKKISPNCY